MYNVIRETFSLKKGGRWNKWNGYATKTWTEYQIQATFDYLGADKLWLFPST
jgi:hypothetical protein